MMNAQEAIIEIENLLKGLDEADLKKVLNHMAKMKVDTFENPKIPLYLERILEEDAKVLKKLAQ